MWYTVKEGERSHVGVDPGSLIHFGDDVNKHVPTEREDHDESPEALSLAGGWIDPGAEVTEIDLRLLAWGRIVTEHGELEPARAIGDELIQIAVETAQRSFHTLFV